MSAKIKMPKRSPTMQKLNTYKKYSTLCAPTRCTNLASTLSKIYHQYFAIKVVGFVINIHSAVNMTHTKLEKK